MTRPAPPHGLDAEALAEWERVCGELETLGQLDKTDRAILTLYAQTWSINQAAAALVAQHGGHGVIKFPNGMTGQAPFYKTQKETAAQLRGLLNDLGLTPAARAAAAKPADEDLADLSI